MNTPHRQRLLAALIFSAFGAPAIAAPSTAELEKQLKALQESVRSLQSQLQAVMEAQPATAPSTVAAAPDENVASKDDINGLQADLENFKYQVQRDRDTRTALSARALNVSGVIQARYGATDTAVNTNGNSANAVKGRNNSFDLGAVLIGFNGNLYKDYEDGRNLDYTLRFGTSPQQGTNNSFLNLIDANLTYNILPTISADTGRLSVTFGQQLLPFGQEVQATEDLKPTINNALFTSLGNLDLARRQVGLIFRGDAFPVVDYGYNYRAPILTYAFGLVNGNGPNKSDDNNNKDLVGRVALTLPADYNSWLRQLSVGASIYRGKQNVFVNSGADLVDKGKKDRYGFDVAYNHHPFGVTYEYTDGRDEYATGTKATYSVAERRSRAHTGTFFYNIGEQFVKGYRAQGRYDDWWPKSYQPFYRYDRFDPNTDAPRDAVKVHTVGLNVFFAETSKFQLNLNRTTFEATDKTTNDLLAQFQFGF